jgi:hypothetical protein
MIPRIHKKHVNLILENNKMDGVNWTDVIHTCLEESDYSLLKLLHKNLNTYSIGKIIREMLKIFFGFFDRHGNNCDAMVRKYLEKIKRKLKLLKGRSLRFFQLTKLLAYKIDYDQEYFVDDLVIKDILFT